MIHPFTPNLSKLKDSEVEDKLSELNKKYFLAYKMGNGELLTQLATFVNIYKAEVAKRYQAKVKSQNNGDLEQLINVD